MKKLIFLCQNNKGRSPALEFYTKSFLDESKSKNLQLYSAGISQLKIESLKSENHLGISRNVQQILNEQGIDTSSHKIKYLGELPKPNLILVSDQHTLEVMLNEFPNYKDISSLAGEFAGSKRYKEIHGPYSSTREIAGLSEIQMYKKMIAEIKYISRKIARKLSEGF